MFSKAADVDRLLGMLKDIDPMRDNLADNEEIQVCTCRRRRGYGAKTGYRSCIGLA